MIGFKIGSLKLIFRFGFFAAAALFCLIDTQGLALCTFCSCIIHETGHIIAAVLCNVKIEKIIFGFGGIKMVSECKIKSLRTDIFILLSGPLFNFAAAFFYFYCECYSAWSVNLILGAFNLLLFSGLDGGAIAEKILVYSGLDSRGIMKIAALLSAAAVCVILYFLSVENILLYAVIIFLAVCQFFY